jgi:molybdenum cofactor cytidylyltransferase/nicotine blue oxidoreductase
MGGGTVDRVAGLLLAAGGGRRIGAPKALLRRGDRLLVESAVEILREAGCSPVVVVLGAGVERVRARADLGDATVVVNDAWATGLGSSLRAGLAALADTDAVAAVVLLVDLPGITPEAVRRVAALPYPEALVCATYGGRRGHPMLLGRAHWSGISTLAKVDVGARPYLLARAGQVLDVACDGVASDDDVDTPETAAAWGITPPADARPTGAADPRAADPRAADPRAADPRAADPRAADPGPAAPGPTPPDPATAGAAPDSAPANAAPEPTTAGAASDSVAPHPAVSDQVARPAAKDRPTLGSRWRSRT